MSRPCIWMITRHHQLLHVFHFHQHPQQLPDATSHPRGCRRRREVREHIATAAIAPATGKSIRFTRTWVALVAIRNNFLRQGEWKIYGIGGRAGGLLRLLPILLRSSSVQRLLMRIKHSLGLGDFGLERWCLGLELPQGRGGKLQQLQCRQGQRAQRTLPVIEDTCCCTYAEFC